MSTLHLDVFEADEALSEMLSSHNIITTAINNIRAHVFSQLRDEHNWSGKSAFSFFDKVERMHTNFYKQLEQLELLTTS